MAKNIEMNILGQDGQYEVLYPNVSANSIVDFSGDNPLLTQSVANAFGLSSDAVPNDVLQVLTQAAIVKDGEFKLPSGDVISNLNISFGSYNGTGLSGENNPCSLTFSRAIKYIRIFARSYTDGTYYEPLINGYSQQYSDSRNQTDILVDLLSNSFIYPSTQYWTEQNSLPSLGYYNYVSDIGQYGWEYMYYSCSKITDDKKTLSWFTDFIQYYGNYGHSTNYSEYQFNQSGYKYYYYVIFA